MELAVLLRNCAHDENVTGSIINATHKRIRYALKCETFTIQYAKSPMQLAMLGQSPELIDLNIFRPSITITGIVDTVGQTTSKTPLFQNMESVDVGRKYWNGVKYEDVTQTYYVPFKNALEGAAATWINTETTQLELEIGNANFPLYNTAAEPNSSDVVAVYTSLLNEALDTSEPDVSVDDGDEFAENDVIRIVETYTSLLNGALNTSVVEVVVDDGSEFSENDVIKIVNSADSNAFEEMLVTGISSNTLTVTRGYNKTVAAAHADNAAINGTAFEEMLVTDIDSNTLTVTRAYNSTSAAKHADNATITKVETETGGGIYIVAVQQARFNVSPGTEDRYEFTMQFVCEARKDTQFNVD